MADILELTGIAVWIGAGIYVWYTTHQLRKRIEQAIDQVISDLEREISGEPRI